eukprot:TRINITY_DN5610_c0_g1_i2.p1 TRINITY_DN5610_c0_g1~~TRINITY_DN5610_c0_g1_i2.p1  ORF type:complete len:458 (+),score=98.38 TRINITY_DN5610_c0_g1_i2:32-1375(+)
MDSRGDEEIGTGYSSITEREGMLGFNDNIRDYDIPFYRKKNFRLAAIAGAGIIVFITFLVIVLVLISHHSSKNDSPIRLNRPKNLIFLISDGYGPASVGLARTMSNSSKLPMDPFIRGLVASRSSSSLVTDSAAGATAYSCAHRTNNRFIAVTPDHLPCGTTMESAIQQLHMKSGIIVTSSLTDATPASFSSHVLDRGSQQLIAQQQISKNINLLLGGGDQFYSNITPLIQQQKYTTIYNSSSLSHLLNSSLSSNSFPEKILGIFSPLNLPYEIDRPDFGAEVPSLSQMVNFGLKHLHSISDDNGFFLFIEGSRIDHAGHQNDAAAQYMETLEYNKAWEHVIDFITNVDPNTMVVASSDHETGGLTLGNEALYYTWEPDTLRKVKRSSERIVSLTMESKGSRDTMEVLEEMMGTWGGVWNLTAEEKGKLEGAVKKGDDYNLSIEDAK